MRDQVKLLSNQTLGVLLRHGALHRPDGSARRGERHENRAKRHVLIGRGTEIN